MCAWEGEGENGNGGGGRERGRRDRGIVDKYKETVYNQEQRKSGGIFLSNAGAWKSLCHSHQATPPC